MDEKIKVSFWPFLLLLAMTACSNGKERGDSVTTEVYAHAPLHIFRGI